MDDRSRHGVEDFLRMIDAKLDEHHKHLRSIDEKMDDSLRRTRALKRRSEFIMASLAELQSAVADVGSALSQNGQDQARIAADVDTAVTLIQQLQAGGTGGINSTDLDPIVQSLKDTKAAMDSSNAAIEAAAAKLEAVAPGAPPTTAR